jgi:hypothetical protein
MVRKNGKAGYRSFTLLGAAKSAMCRTKGVGGRFISKSAAGAAKKAFSDLCRTKRIRGVCTLYVNMKDTTAGARTKGKVYSYKIVRQKLNPPLIRLEGTDKEYVIEYAPKIVASLKDMSPVPCGKDPVTAKTSQTRGRKKKRTAKKTKASANNVRRMFSLNNLFTTPKEPTRRSRRVAINRKANMIPNELKTKEQKQLRANVRLHAAVKKQTYRVSILNYMLRNSRVRRRKVKAANKFKSN